MESRIAIIVDPDGTVRGARVVKGELASIDEKAKTTTSAIQFMNRALATLGIGLSLATFTGFADTFTEIQNRLRVAGVETQNLTSVNKQLLDISNETRTSFESNVALYGRLSIAGRELGTTQEELLEFVNTVGSGLAIQGGAAGTAAGAILQLSQALGGVKIQAQEFNSILDGAFPIALAAAKGLDAAGGSVGKLRALVIEGKVSSEEFFRAILSQSRELEEQFSRTTPTISQAFTVLNNELVNFIGGMAEANSITSTVSQTIIDLSLNLDTAAGLIAVFTAAFAPSILSSIARGLFTAATAAGALVASFGPIGLIAGAISAAAAAVAIFGDEFQPIEGSLVTLQDLGVATFNIISRFATETSSVIGTDLRNAALGFGITFDNALSLGGSAMEFFRSLVLRSANFVINSFRAVIEGATTVSTIVQKVFSGDFEGALETGGGLREQIQNIFSEDVIGKVESQAKDFISRIGESILAEAEKRAREREAAAAASSGGTGDDGDDDGDDTFELTKKQTQAFAALRDELDPVGAAQRDVAEAQLLLSSALKAGVIDLEEFTRLMIRLGETTRDQIDPLAAVNRELQQERNLLKLAEDEREVGIQLREIENDLRQKGISLSEEEKEALRANLTELREFNDQVERQDALLKEIRGPQEDYQRNLEALGQLLMDDLISIEEFNQAVREQREELLRSGDSIGDGIRRAASGFTDFSDIVERSTRRAFRGAEDSLLEFVQTGKLEVSDLADSIQADLARIAIRQGIINPIANSLFGGGTGAGGAQSSGFNISSLAGLLNFIPGFDEGGSVVVGGRGGIDNNILSLNGAPVARVSRGERVDVSPSGSRDDGRPMVVLNVNGVQNVDEFNRNSNMLLTQAADALTRARKIR